MRKTYKKGFTLVELSVVIIIVGLIIAGVSQASAMFSEAQLRTIARDI